MTESYSRMDCRTMSVFTRYPVIVLERNAVEDYFKMNHRATKNDSKEVGSKLSEVEIKEENISEVSAESSVKTETEIYPCSVKNEVGISVSSGKTVYPDKKLWISDLLVKIKKEQNEPDEVTYKLVGSLPYHSVDENLKPLLIKRESVESENYHNDKTNISASNVPSSNKSISVEAFEEYLRSSQIHSNVFLASSGNKAVDAPVMPRGSFSGGLQKGYSNEYFCSCFYCQGEFRDNINARYCLKNQGTEQMQCSDSKKESEVQNPEKQSSHNQSKAKFNDENTPWKDLDVFGVKRSFQYKQCHAKFEFSRDLNHIMEVHSEKKVFKCKLCPAKFNSSCSLKSHQETHSNDKTFQCHLCPKNFKHTDHLKSHLIVHSDEKTFKCNHCSAEFEQKAYLKKHTTVHSNGRTFKCNHCSAVFKQKAYLKKHATVHSDERTFKCNHCSAEFKRKADLKKHTTVHSDERCFKCNYCSAEFKRKAYLKKHMTVHSDERSFKCNYCSAEFKQKAYLKKHKIVHSDERPFECEICGVKFKEKNALKEHMESHSDGKPLKCELCPARLKNQRSLRQHMRLHVYEQVNAKLKQSKILEHMLLHKDQGPFECKLCSAKSKINASKTPLKLPCDKGPFVCAHYPVKLKNRTLSNHAKVQRMKANRIEWRSKSNECPKAFGNSIEQTTAQKRERNLPPTSSSDDDWSPVTLVGRMSCSSSFTFSKGASEPSSIVISEERVNLSVGELNERLKPHPKDTSNVEEPCKINKCPRIFENCLDAIEPSVFQKEERNLQLTNSCSNQLPVDSIVPMIYRSNVTSKPTDAAESSIKTVISNEPSGNIPAGVLDERQVCNGELSECDKLLKNLENCGVNGLMPSVEGRATQLINHPSNDLSPFAAVEPKLNGALESSCNAVILEEQPLTLSVEEMNEVELSPIEASNIEDSSKCDDCLQTFDNCASLIEHLIPPKGERSFQSTKSFNGDLAPVATVSPKPVMVDHHSDDLSSNTTFEPTTYQSIETSTELIRATKPSYKTVILDEQPVNLPVGKANEIMEPYPLAASILEEPSKCDECREIFDDCACLIEHLIPRREPINSPKDDLTQSAPISPRLCSSNETSPKVDDAAKLNRKTVTSDEPPVNLPVVGTNEIVEPYLSEAGNTEELSESNECLQRFDNFASLISPTEERSLQRTCSPTDDPTLVTTIGPITCPSVVTSSKLNGAMEHNSKIMVSDELLVTLTVKELNKRLKPYPKETVLEYKLRRRTLKNRGYARNGKLRRVRQCRGSEKQNKALEAELSLIKERIQKAVRYCACKVERKISVEKIPINEVVGLIPRVEREEPCDGTMVS